MRLEGLEEVSGLLVGGVDTSLEKYEKNKEKEHGTGPLTKAQISVASVSSPHCGCWQSGIGRLSPALTEPMIPKNIIPGTYLHKFHRLYIPGPIHSGICSLIDDKLGHLVHFIDLSHAPTACWRLYL